MNITAKDVAGLRKMTGAPMMDCKSALTESNGDVSIAKDLLRKKGLQAVDKKAGRETNEGLVAVGISNNTAYVVEVNCETDFVSRNKVFQDFVQEYLEMQYDQRTFDDVGFAAQVSKIGENIELGRKAKIKIKDDERHIYYIHNGISGSMGDMVVVLSYTGGDADLAKPVAMHIAASNPKAIKVEDLDQDWVKAETKFLTDQALESGKPPEIVKKIISGRMNKVLREVTLLDQPFVVNPETTVGAYLKENGMQVTEFVRIKIGD